MLYPKQKKQLTNILKEVDELEHNLAELGCFICGGAITSIFTGKEVNDLDVYFRCRESLNTFIEIVFDSHIESKPCLPVFANVNPEPINLNSFGLRYVGHTKKSIILVTQSGQEVQLIINKFYDSPQDIFDTYDFHLNMGCYDCKEENFVLSNNFLLDNASRHITVNPRTSYPIISQLRLAKYQERGYTINRKDFLMLACAVAQLELHSWEDVKESIGGLYGYNVDDIFNEDKDFTFEELFDQLEKLEPNDTRFTGLEYVACEKKLIEHINGLHKEG